MVYPLKITIGPYFPHSLLDSGGHEAISPKDVRICCAALRLYLYPVFAMHLLLISFLGTVGRRHRESGTWAPASC